MAKSRMSMLAYVVSLTPVYRIPSVCLDDSHSSFSKELVLVIEPTESRVAQNPALFTVDDDDESKKEKRQLNQSARIHFDANATQFGRTSREAPLFRGMDEK